MANKNTAALKALKRYTEVEIENQTIRVKGLGVMRIAELATKYPAVQALLLEGGKGAERIVLDIPSFAIEAIACAMEDDTDEGREEVADLAPDHLATILEAVIDATMPDGIDPFVEKLGRLMAKFSIKSAEGESE